MVAEPVALPHPITAGVDAIEAALDHTPVGAWDGLEDELIRTLVGRLMRIESRVRAHVAAGTRVLDETGFARRAGATSTGSLLAGDFGGDRAAGNRLVQTGKTLSAAPVIEDALAAGQITERQATIIADATTSLDTTDEIKHQCQRQLLTEAQQLTAKDLERRAQRTTDIYKPTIEADADENNTLEQREARAWAKAAFRMWDNHNGTYTGEFTLPEAQADTLKAAIEAIAAPRRDHLTQHPNDTVGERPTGTERLGRGFATLCDHLPTNHLTTTTATMIVRLDHTTLAGAAKPATLDTGTRISAAEARLTACTAGIMPAVYAGASLMLDFGRERRLFTPTQKQAIADRDRGCTFPGCDRPPPWCETHHYTQPWSNGGTTNLNDGVLLCAHHHRITHQQHWKIRQHHNGHIQYQQPGTNHWQHNTRWKC